MRRYVLLLLILFIPIVVKADGIKDYYIDATIEKDGSLLVQEYFSLTGEYNGFERIINYANSEAYEFNPNLSSFGGSDIHNGSDVEILEVRGIPQYYNFDFNQIEGEKFREVHSASKGDDGVYTVDYVTNGKSVLMYNPSKNERNFYIKYRLYDMAIRHNDIAEIGWNFVGTELRENITNLKLYLHIPNNKNLKAWAHGPLNGDVKILDSETVLVTIRNLYSYRSTDVRATFDLSVIPECTKVTNTDALDKILAYEMDKAEQANYERQQQDNIRIKEAEESLNSFEKYVSRSGYEWALRDIMRIQDDETRNLYLKRLNDLKVVLDRKENEEAEYLLDRGFEYPKFSNYALAKDSVDPIDNEENKKVLLVKLDELEKKVRDIESKKEKKNYIIGGIFITISLIVVFVVYRKFYKDPKVNFDISYLDAPPSDLSPGIVSYLWKKKIIGNAISATVLDMIRKKIIVSEKISEKNYRLTINSNYKEDLTPAEEKIKKLVFLGNESIETKKMKSSAKSHYETYYSAWDSFCEIEQTEGKNKKYYVKDECDIAVRTSKKDKNAYLIIILLTVLSMILFSSMFVLLIISGLTIIYGWYLYKAIKSNNKKEIVKWIFVLTSVVQTLVSIFTFAYIMITKGFYRSSSVLFIISTIIGIFTLYILFNQRQKTEYGALEHKKWMAFKRYLNDFGSFKDKGVIEVVLWEKYLVYATLFGCSKKILKSIPNELVDAPIDYEDLYWQTRIISHCISTSHSSAVAAYNTAHSSSGSGFSSGGGGGGGFSSGGGSFGGGGGGGRF